MRCSAGNPWVLAFMSIPLHVATTWIPLSVLADTTSHVPPIQTPTRTRLTPSQQRHSTMGVTHHKNCLGPAWGTASKACKSTGPPIPIHLSICGTYWNKTSFGGPIQKHTGFKLHSTTGNISVFACFIFKLCPHVSSLIFNLWKCDSHFPCSIVCFWLFVHESSRYSWFELCLSVCTCSRFCFGIFWVLLAAFSVLGFYVFGFSAFCYQSSLFFQIPVCLCVLRLGFCLIKHGIYLPWARSMVS